MITDKDRKRKASSSDSSPRRKDKEKAKAKDTQSACRLGEIGCSENDLHKLESDFVFRRARCVTRGGEGPAGVT